MAANKVKPAFDQKVVVLPIDHVVPQREITTELRNTSTYRRISASDPFKRQKLYVPTWWECDLLTLFTYSDP